MKYFLFFWCHEKHYMQRTHLFCQKQHLSQFIFFKYSLLSCFVRSKNCVCDVYQNEHAVTINKDTSGSGQTFAGCNVPTSAIFVCCLELECFKLSDRLTTTYQTSGWSWAASLKAKIMKIQASGSASFSVEAVVDETRMNYESSSIINPFKLQLLSCEELLLFQSGFA